MPVTATLLGTAITSGTDPTVPITVSQPAGSVVIVVAAAYTLSTFPLSQGFRTTPTDDAGGTWSFSSPHPFIGNTGDNFGPIGSKVAGNIMGATRTGGTDLSGGGSGPQPRPGCTTCGSMLLGTPTGTLGGGGGSGSVVTLHFENTDPPPPDPVLAIIFAVEGIQNDAETDDQSQYGNGDSYPNGGTNPSALIWSVDVGAGHVPTPDADCVMYTGVSAYGTNGFAPVNGTVLAEIDAAPGYLAVSFTNGAAGGVAIEPGGSFNHAGSLLVGNYQFAKLV